MVNDEGSSPFNMSPGRFNRMSDEPNFLGPPVNTEKLNEVNLRKYQINEEDNTRQDLEFFNIERANLRKPKYRGNSLISSN
jgi:hypothetical protein